DVCADGCCTQFRGRPENDRQHHGGHGAGGQPAGVQARLPGPPSQGADQGRAGSQGQAAFSV
ncbi:putative epimerase, partial [Haematococcus lacustris]